MAGPWEDYAQPEAGSQQAGPWTEYAQQKPTPTPVVPVSRLEKVLRGMKDPLDGAAQLLEHAMPDSFNSANRSINNWIADKTGMLAHVPTPLEAAAAGGKPGLDGLINQQEQAYQAKRSAGGESGFDGYRVIGNVASPMNLAIAAKAPAAATLLGRIGVGALGGGASAALNPVIGDGDYWGQKGGQMATGAAFGAAMAPIAGAVARVISPNASKNAQLELLKNEGVSPTIGQSLGGGWNAAEEKLQSLPLMGDAITAARQRAKEQFNQAAIDRATGPVGGNVQGVGQSAVADAGDMISQAYNQGKAALGNFQLDQQAGSELANLRQMVTQLPKQEQKQFGNIYRTFQTEITPQGHLLADGFKRIDSKLSDTAAQFSGSGDAYQKQLGSALSEMQRIITDNAKRANPQAADMLNKADTAWANLVRVEGAATAAKGTGGVFTPGQLLTAVRGADQSVRDRATARGTALMQDLGNAGQSVLGNKIPDSGTAGRAMWGAGALASGAVAPAIPLGLLGGAAMYSGPAQSLLRGAVSSRGQYAEPIADAFRQAYPFLVPGAAQMGLGLLNY